MPVYLISIEEQSLIASYLKDTGLYWYNSNLNYIKINQEIIDGLWITGTTYKKINRELKKNIKVYAEIPEKPIFFGSITSHINKKEYQEALTALCISREDGNEIQAISYLQPFWNDEFCFDLKRCFHFKMGSDPDYRWRVIGHYGDINWLINHWEEESGFSKWLKRHNIKVETKWGAD